MSLLRPEYSASSWKHAQHHRRWAADLIARAHSAGPGTLDRGPLAKEPSARKRDQHGGNIASKLPLNDSKIVPTWLPNGAWRPLGGLLEVSWRSLGALKKAWLAKGGLPDAYEKLLEASWGALGAKKSSLERLLAAPREIPRQVSAILGAKRLPKGSPRGSKIEPKRRLEPKTRFLQTHTLFFNVFC